MLSKSSVIAGAEVEGLGPILGPIGFIIERRSIPDHLKHELWDLNGMGRRAIASRQKRCWSILRIRYMVLVIRRVKVLAIPARRVDDVRTNTTQTRYFREPLRVQLRISARRSIIAAEVGTRVASEAGLVFVL
jgi:hypothetical protein